MTRRYLVIRKPLTDNTLVMRSSAVPLLPGHLLVPQLHDQVRDEGRHLSPTPPRPRPARRRQFRTRLVSSAAYFCGNSAEMSCKTARVHCQTQRRECGRATRERGRRKGGGGAEAHLGVGDEHALGVGRRGHVQVPHHTVLRLGPRRPAAPRCVQNSIMKHDVLKTALFDARGPVRVPHHANL
jgi:hypothetical protein